MALIIPGRQSDPTGMNSGAGFRGSIDGQQSQIDLMDSTIQGLYGLGLKLEYCLALLDESPEQARDGLDAAVNDVGHLIEPLRRQIQGLRRPASARISTRPTADSNEDTNA